MQNKKYNKDIFKHYRDFRSHIKISLKDFERRVKFYKRRFRNILPENKRSSVLELGGGEGFFLYFMEKMGYQDLWGIDINEEELNIAKYYCKKVKIIKSDIIDFLKTTDLNFDFIMMESVLEHFEKEKIYEILKLVNYRLKKGGKVVVCVPNTGSPWGIPISFIDFTHETYFTSYSLMQILKISGFKIIEIKGDGYPLPIDFLSGIRSIFYYPLRLFTKILLLIMSGGGGREKILHIPDPLIIGIAEKE